MIPELSGARRSVPVRWPWAGRAISVKSAPDVSSGRRGVPGRRGLGVRSITASDDVPTDQVYLEHEVDFDQDEADEVPWPAVPEDEEEIA